VADEPFSLFATPDTDARRRLGPCRPARRKFANEEAAEDRHGSSSGKNRDRYIDPAERSWRELLTDPDLNAVVAFSLIGLLLALTLMFRFPDLGALIAQYNQAPVSMPITWNQVKKGLDPTRFTVRTAPALIAKSAAWKEYCKSERPLAATIKRLVKAKR
jgi:hypothetical protein